MRLILNKDRMLPPIQYYETQSINLLGNKIWRSALCPFHNDKNPSLRINTQSGGFKCMACEEKGGDTIAFHMKLHNKTFKEAAKELGAWVDKKY